MLDVLAGDPAQDRRPLRVLILSHAHPQVSNGGAEIAAFALHNGMRERPDTCSWFLGATTRASYGRSGTTIVQPFGADNYLYVRQGPYDNFTFANRDTTFWREFRELLLDLSPDVIHAHHYTELGVELFGFARRVLPHVATVLTLHEYLAICNNYGQMVKTRTLELCDAGGPVACSACFSERGPRDFFLRRRYIQENLADVDAFVAPSRFLAGRFAAWGLPAHKLQVIENVQPMPLPFADRTGAPCSRRASPRLGIFGRMSPFKGVDRTGEPASRRPALRLGFFGQMSPLKGIDVLIGAMQHLWDARVESVTLDIFGDSSNQPPEFQAAIADALRKAGPNVRVRGRYRNAEVLRLMQGVDAVVVPSIWWENSPLVIQEAFAAGRPVICSNIGGMAEKVRPGVDGWHFEARSALDLSRVLRDLAADPAQVANVARRLAARVSADAVVAAHRSLYLALLRTAEEVPSGRAAAPAEA